MIAAAIGGTILFISILLFVAVALGMLFTPRTEHEPATFAPVEEEALQTPPVFDRISRWAVLAVVLAVLAYAGPIHELLVQHAYGAPGMRTW